MADGPAPLRLRLLPDALAVARLPGGSAVPAWADGAGVVCITRRADELSVVCADARVPPDVRAERGWRALEVAGPIPFEAVGVLHALTGPLATAGVSLFALSTFDTDVVLVRTADLDRAIGALREAGHLVDG